MSARRNVLALVSGVLFAAGLGLAGMTKPAKVEAFLDVAGDWDPSLLFVMAGAIGVYAVAVVIARRRGAPLFAPTFTWPHLKDIDVRLVGGAAIFGVGWGLSGWCPGPAIVSVATLSTQAIVFSVTLAVTLVVVRRFVAGARAPSALPPADRISEIEELQ